MNKEMHKEVLYLLSDEFRESHAALPIPENLSKGKVPSVDLFEQYKDAFTEQLGDPYVVRHGDPPINEGAVYVSWRHGDHCIDLSYRGCSEHYRRHGEKPFVDFQLRDPWPDMNSLTEELVNEISEAMENIEEMVDAGRELKDAVEDYTEGNSGPLMEWLREYVIDAIFEKATELGVEVVRLEWDLVIDLIMRAVGA